MGFILCDQKDSLCVPRGAWVQFECCKTRNTACLLSVCPNYTVPEPVAWETLERIYPRDRLTSLRQDRKKLYEVFEIAEDIEIGSIVTAEDEKNILNPLLLQVSAVIMGAREAYANKSIVIVPDVGSHHASVNVADGACLFADVPLAWLLLRDKIIETEGVFPRALYIDVDVHHANGFAQTRVECGMQDHFFMIDLYNQDIWPMDEVSGSLETVQHTNIPVPFHSGIRNKAYISLLSSALKRAETELPPVNIVFYMCSNDAMMGDPLGKTNVTERAIYERDQIVVKWARDRNLPIVIMPSRGYGPTSCRVIRESMARLNDEYNIF